MNVTGLINDIEKSLERDIVNAKAVGLTRARNAAPVRTGALRRDLKWRKGRLFSSVPYAKYQDDDYLEQGLEAAIDYLKRNGYEQHINSRRNT